MASGERVHAENCMRNLQMWKWMEMGMLKSPAINAPAAAAGTTGRACRAGA